MSIKTINNHKVMKKMENKIKKIKHVKIITRFEGIVARVSADKCKIQGNELSCRDLEVVNGFFIEIYTKLLIKLKNIKKIVFFDGNFREVESWMP